MEAAQVQPIYLEAPPSALLSGSAPDQYLVSPLEDADDCPGQDGHQDEDAGKGDHESDVADKVDPLVVETCIKNKCNFKTFL
jgi:hypothetical protein